MKTAVEIIHSFEFPDGCVDCDGEELIEELKPIDDRIAQLEAALKEAMEWNWLDEDSPVPYNVESMCVAALAGSSVETTCDHDWVDARNAVIESGEFCRKCGAIRAGNATSDRGAKP